MFQERKAQPQLQTVMISMLSCFALCRNLVPLIYVLNMEVDACGKAGQAAGVDATNFHASAHRITGLEGESLLVGTLLIVQVMYRSH